jgi:RNA polymerase sigma-54 factor
MQKLGLNQSMQQKLSPQQIQFIKLLQIPTMELEHRIEEELEMNPALEELDERLSDEKEEKVDEEYDDDLVSESLGDVNLEEYINNDDIAGYKMQGDGPSADEERDIPIATADSLTERLMTQLGYLRLDDRQHAIAEQLIGSIDDDGYIKRDPESIVNDLAFTQNIMTDAEEVETLLRMVQQFDPPGIGAGSLQECLLIQLERREHITPAVRLAKHILEDTFEEFTKKHYTKICKKLDIDEEELKEALEIILRLDPKPGGYTNSMVKNQYLIPDFTIREEGGKLTVSLNARNAPELRVSRSYSEMFEAYEKSDKKDKKLKQTVSFVKQKLESAKWFIDAIKQRQETLLKTMNAIVQHQYDFFLTGDETKLKPMILKDIADKINMDISTVSRVANSKAVETEFGLFPLKFFFSEGIQTESGEDVSSKEVKSILKQIIEDEDKQKPLSDDKLEKMLKLKGYNIARRTVAKYREQLGIPVARLRKEL